MGIVNDLIADARSYASNAQAEAASLVAAAQSQVASMMSGPWVSGGPGYGAPADQDIPDDVPEFSPPSVEVGDIPDDLTGLLSYPAMDFGTLAENDAVNPGFTEPVKPSALRSFTLAPPDVTTDFTFPDPPDKTPIEAPVIVARDEPDAPDVLIPVFDAVRPADIDSPPDDLPEQFEAAYRGIAPTMYAALSSEMDTLLARYNPEYHTQMAAIEDRLATYIAGGTGLTPAVENAIWERSKAKVNAEYLRTRDTVYGEAAARGMTLPDGALTSALLQARQAGADNNSMAAIEISIKQAELEQKNLQFAVTTSSQLRSTVMNAAVGYHGSLVTLNGQALEYAKTIVDALVQVYDLLVKAYTARLDGYRTEAVVYETRMRGALAAIEIYKAEIDALKALTEVDLAKVTLYQARIQALNIYAQIYKTEVDTVVAQASLEKLKIELFGEQVRAFSVEAQAKSAEWQGYTAAVNGQEAKLRAYGEEVRAYVATVEAYRARVQAKSVEVNAATEYNRGRIAEYTAQVQAYAAKVDAKAKLASAQIDYNKTLLLAFQARMSAHEAQAKVNLENWKAQALRAVEEFRALSTSAIEQAKISSQQISSVAAVSMEGARVYGQLANAAMSGMNTLSANIEYPTT